jgi:multidrug resistance protein
VGTHGLQWVVDAYTVVLASLLVVSGALADRWGRRRVFRCGLLVFGLASLACALAPSLGVLIAARAVQGIGASMLSPVALAIVVNAMPDPRERARAIGVWASVFGLGMAAGPVTGGALIAAFGWRSVFWINAPVIVVALVLVAVFVPESRAARARGTGRGHRPLRLRRRVASGMAARGGLRSLPLRRGQGLTACGRRRFPGRIRPTP